MEKIRFDWTILELKDIYDSPLIELISKANAVHSLFHDRRSVQVCSLISIKTGGCPEDCKYCAQSSRYQTAVSAEPMMEYEEVLTSAKRAIAKGATRICLGAAWKEVRDSKQFDQVLKIVKGVADLGVEVCCTLGMLKDHQAQRLKDAGLYAYNHNLDTSEKFYRSIVTTRTYKDRLDTIDVVERAGLSVCCGAILGLGETIEDRLEFLQTISSRQPHPESVPINRLVPIEGTPLEGQPMAGIWELVRMIAVARIVLPASMIRLSAGRLEMTHEQQALCMLAGANSIFSGDRLLTISNPSFDADEELFKRLGLKKRPAYEKEKSFNERL